VLKWCWVLLVGWCVRVKEALPMLAPLYTPRAPYAPSFTGFVPGPPFALSAALAQFVIPFVEGLGHPPVLSLLKCLLHRVQGSLVTTSQTHREPSPDPPCTPRTPLTHSVNMHTKTRAETRSPAPCMFPSLFFCTIGDCLAARGRVWVEGYRVRASPVTTSQTHTTEPSPDPP
jgi:hypothetical protein